MRLLESLAGDHEFVRCLGVELKHVVVAGNDEPGTDGLREGGGLGAVQIAGHAAFGLVAVDGQESDVDGAKDTTLGHDVIMPKGVAAVIEAEGAAFHQKADVSAVSVLIADDVVVLRHGRLDLPLVIGIHIAFTEGEKIDRSTLQALQHLTADGVRMVKTIAGICRGERNERVAIQMIGVHMTGSDA